MMVRTTETFYEEELESRASIMTICSQAPSCSLLFVTPMNPGFLLVQCDTYPKDGLTNVK